MKQTSYRMWILIDPDLDLFESKWMEPNQNLINTRNGLKFGFVKQNP